MRHLTEQVKTSIAITTPNGVAAQTAIEGVTLDMQGFDAFRVILAMGAITATAVTSLKIQQGALANMSDAADLEGTGDTIAADADNTLFISDIIRPTERYVRVYVSRGTADAVVAVGIYEQYIAREEVITESSDVTSEETHVTPDEGTA